MPLHSTKPDTACLEEVALYNNPIEQWLKTGRSPLTLIYIIFKTNDLCCENKG